MKKLLLLFLFLPLLTFGQNVQFGLKLVNQDTDAVVDETNPIQEGEVLRMELHMSAVGTADYDALVNFKYLFLDIQYNHDLITPVEGCFDFPGIGIISDPGVVTEKYDFSNTSFNSLDNHNLMQKYIDWKAGNISYAPQNAKWSVVRIAIQLSTKSFQDLLSPGDYTTATSIFDMCFDVKPGSAADVEKEFRINLAGLEDTAAALPTSIYADKSEARYLYSIEEAVTYSTKLHFDLPNTLDPTNFQVNVAKGSMGLQEMPTTYTLDANADVVINDVKLDSVYSLFTLEPIDGSYIPDVHTVTDAYRAFKFLTDVGINGGDYIYNGFEGFSADANLDGTLNSADTYGILAYVMGVDVSGGDGPGYCLPEQAEDGTWYHGCTATVKIEDYNEEVLGASVALNKSEGGTGGGWSSEFTPTEEGQTFTFGYWHHVDLDQSHSTAYPAQITAKAAKADISLSSKAVGTVNFDMVSKIEGGQVIVELNHSGTNIVGMQARIKYDTNRLVLKDIVYDTGNTATNFSKTLNKGLLFGSLSVDGSTNIKEGIPFKLIFDTVGTVNNTTGLFYFENTDAVRANGDKLTLNIN
jgi:hypothetical protein